jgi:hypothetical protein
MSVMLSLRHLCWFVYITQRWLLYQITGEGELVS